MYDLKKIMKNAWETYRTNAKMTFGEALKLAWTEVKIEKINSREVITTKIKNEISKKLKGIIASAEIKMTTISTGVGFSEAENGKMKRICVDMGTRFIDQVSNSEKITEILTKAFKILEHYNKSFKFDYSVDRCKFRSNRKNFKNHNSIYDLFNI